MTGQQVIDEITDDRVGLVSQFRYDPANQSAAAAVPFQVDRTVRGLAMDFGPTVRTTRPLVFSRNQVKPPELRIGHDLFAQRSTPGRDDLDHRLHQRRFNRKSSLLQCLFGEKGLSVGFTQRAVHHINIDMTLFRVPKRTRQSANDLETELLPQTDRRFVGRNNKIELHRPKTEAARFT